MGQAESSTALPSSIGPAIPSNEPISSKEVESVETASSTAAKAQSLFSRSIEIKHVLVSYNFLGLSYHFSSIEQDEENDSVTEKAAFAYGEPVQNGAGPPKVDTYVEVLYEKVTKQIIMEGHAQKPSKYTTCFLHYRAWTESTNHKFEDT
ncbi:Peptidyl-prolyl cis-trans isomerase FKBP42-like protein [Drosera capensis]